MRSKYERKTQKDFESRGWEVDWKAKPPRPIRGYNRDFLGRFDLLCWDRKGTLSFVAIKGRKGVPSKLRRAVEEFNPKIIQKEIWTYRKNKLPKREIIE